MAISTAEISQAERDKLLSLPEGHFSELKGIRIAPSKLTRTIAALSNAEGGEVYIGIEEDKTARSRSWAGFEAPENANAHIQTFEQLFPLGEGYSYTFLKSTSGAGYVLKVEVGKSRDVKAASDGKVYIRRGAQNLPVETAEALTRLRRNKGLISFETEPVNADWTLITNSVVSPGTLPAHITPANILDERFARNAAIVRLINKFPDPPNRDVGEGLNTAFRAMREMKMKPPVISQSGGYVKVILRHESLATPAEIILEYLQEHEQITNRVARDICFIGSENRMKGVLQGLVKKGLIELVPGTTRYSAAYRLVKTKKR